MSGYIFFNKAAVSNFFELMESNRFRLKFDSAETIRILRLILDDQGQRDFLIWGLFANKGEN